MRISLKRGLAGAAAISAAATLVPIIAASPAGAATDIVGSGGTISLTSNSGDASTAFNFNLTASGGSAAVCPGDNNAGYKFSTFVIPASADPASITFTGSGAVTAVAGEYRNNLYSGSTAVRNKFPDPVAATISGIPAMQFSFLDTNTVIPDGTYKIGVACHGGPTGAAPSNFWAKTITISHTGGNFAYAAGAVPAAPSAPTVTPGDESLTVSFGAVTADPAVSSYTATATPQGGGTPVSISGAGSPLTITGLTNGTIYDVTVSATNTVGTSAPSTAVSGTPSRAQLAAPVVTATPLTGGIKATWTAAGGSPTGYTVTVSPDPTTGPYSVTVPATDPREVDITNLAAGVDHTVTVTAIYADPQDVGTPGTATAKPNSDVTVSQTIQAERPAANALVLTQECGNPQCLVDLGTGVLDSTGSYFEATGDLFPVTLTDARDLDLGWTVKGDIADEFQATGDSFDAVALGWTPEVTTFSPQLANGYAQGVVAGPVVAPNEASAPIVNGNAVLMQSVAPGANTGGLGIAKATAGLTLRIPVTAAAGTYTAVLTLSAI